MVLRQFGELMELHFMQVLYSYQLVEKGLSFFLFLFFSLI